MSEKKTMTVREIADELGVSKTAIQHKLSDDFRDEYVIESSVGNKKILKITIAGFEQLKRQFKRKKKPDEKVTSSDSEVIQILKKQLEEKDEQIEKLQILLNQSQQLQLTQNEKIKKLESKTVKEEKKSFWQKFWG